MLVFLAYSTYQIFVILIDTFLGFLNDIAYLINDTELQGHQQPMSHWGQVVVW